MREESTYQSEPREDKIEDLVDKFDVDPELTDERMRGTIDEVEVEGTVDGGEERSVEPSPSLGDQLWYLVGHIRYGIGRLDVVQDPRATAL